MKKICIIDDEPIVLDVLKSHFEEKGMEVSSCANGEEAVKLLLETSPDIVLLDYKLENDMTGLDVLKKAKGSGFSGKAIFSTGALEEKVKEEAQSLGVEIFLNKPILMQALDEAVSQTIGS